MANWIIDKFSDIANKKNESIALVDKDREMTYGNLLCSVAYVAENLKKYGIQKGDVCVVLCDRNICTITSILSIWAVGGVYLPINLSNPDSRNDYTISRSNAKVIIDATVCCDCKSSLFNKYSSLVIRPDFAAEKEIPLEAVDISNMDAAYILFTSGSKGMPKGVKISVGNIQNLFQGLFSGIFSRFEGRLNVALVAPFVFDASIQQIIAALLLGHTLYITQEEQRKNPEKLFEYFIKYNIHIFDCTPTHLKMFNNVIMRQSIANHPLKCAIVGGELLKAETVKSFADRFITKSPYIVNVYGVTECAVDSIFNFFNPNEVEYDNLVPVGIPMEGVVLAIVDESGEIVTNGSSGELYIGGYGVGLGYLDKELNDKSFTYLSKYPGMLFYKTGDIAKNDVESQVICLGRNDRQVKVRGNRIELDEIESCIMRINRFNANKVFCSKCLLDSSSTVIHEDGVCEVCRLYEKNAEKINGFFGKMIDFTKLIEKANGLKKSKYDCMLLYSGGKDSTYVLMRLVEMGYHVLAYTFDNGYLSKQAFNNIRNITNALGVDCIIEKFPMMDQVFSESLKRYHTVCDGCYKVLVTLSTKYAIKHGISAIVNGLNRGQIIETKLKGFLSQEMSDNIFLYLDEQRKIYHYWNDHFYSLVDTPGNPQDIDKISFLDYFFYEDVDEKEIFEYLAKSGIWKMSYDTGLCSTNCQINDVGTVAYYRANGFHNYAAPLSWEVRLKQITREEGMAKLTFNQFDYKYINEKLNFWGIDEKEKIKDCHVILVGERLFAFLKSSDELNISQIQLHLKNELPSYMLPHRFIVLQDLPLTESGKIDDLVLVKMAEKSTASDLNIKNDDLVISEIITIWEKILGFSDFGIEDSFFDIGGDSLDAILMSEEIRERFNYEIPFDEVIEKLTISNIANQIKGGLE